MYVYMYVHTYIYIYVELAIPCALPLPRLGAVLDSLVKSSLHLWRKSDYCILFKAQWPDALKVLCLSLARSLSSLSLSLSLSLSRSLSVRGSRRGRDAHVSGARGPAAFLSGSGRAAFRCLFLCNYLVGNDFWRGTIQGILWQPSDVC
jgi:hypothetical protein